MTSTTTCENINPVALRLDGENWTLIPLNEANASDTPFQFSGQTCSTTASGTPLILNGFTAGEVFISFCCLLMMMFVIFNFIFQNFIKKQR